MDDSNTLDQEEEFEKYLKILQSYLNELRDQKLLEICSAWIVRLSACRDDEKSLRNRYIFALCCQLSKGVLDEPFTQLPPVDSNLLPIVDSLQSENSSEVEYAVVNPYEPNSLANEDDIDKLNFKTSKTFETIMRPSRSINNFNRKVLRCNCSDQSEDNQCSSAEYQFRTASLIRKLRDIKAQNSILYNELESLRHDAQRSQNDCEDCCINKTNRSTSILMRNDSNSTLNSYRTKMKEMQASRNSLIETISELQNKLDNFEDLKRHEIDDIEAKHKLEIIKLKSTIREEITKAYEEKIEQLKLHYENTMNEIQEKASADAKRCMCKTSVAGKNKIIQEKENEISKLKILIDEQKKYIDNVLSKVIDDSADDSSNENVKHKGPVLEKRLHNLKTAKSKCCKCYENKLANLHREKNLGECTMQLQLVKHRAQVARETTDENQIELNKALDKLESKYKEIVANVQSTAIQRRMQDQIALDSILQAACGFRTVCPNVNGQFSGKTACNQNRTCDSDNVSMQLRDKVENKSIGADSLITGYSLDGERMEALFQRLYITQDGRGSGK